MFCFVVCFISIKVKASHCLGSYAKYPVVPNAANQRHQIEHIIMTRRQARQSHNRQSHLSARIDTTDSQRIVRRGFPQAEELRILSLTARETKAEQ